MKIQHTTIWGMQQKSGIKREVCSNASLLKKQEKSQTL